MTVNQWVDNNMSLIFGRQLRLINFTTNKGIGDNYLPYFNNEVLKIKVTTKFIFLYV